MDNLGILIQAILSLKDTTDSKNQIAKELPKLESQLQSDKNTRVKIVAGLDISKSKSLIQSQLNTLANQAKAPTIKVGVDTSGLNSVQGATQNITNSLQTVQTQAQQTASAIKEVTTSASYNISDDAFNRLLKDMQIGKNVTDEYKASIRTLANELNKAWNTHNLEQYNQTLNYLINTLNDGQTKMRSFTSDSAELDRATEELKMYQASIGSFSEKWKRKKFFIDEKLKQELIYVFGSIEEVKSALTSMYGVGNWTFNPQKQIEGFKSLTNYIDKSDAGLSQFGRTLFETFSKAEHGGNHYATFFADIVNKVRTLRDTLKFKATPISEIFSSTDAATATRAIEDMIAKAINLSNYEERNRDVFRGFYEEVTTDSIAMSNDLNNVALAVENVQRAMTPSNKNYFSNSSEILANIKYFNQEENAIRSLEQTFTSLGATVTSVERKNNNGILNGFTVSVKSATGEVENFNYSWQNLNAGLEGADPDWKFALNNITATDKYIQKLAESAKIAQDKLNAMADTMQQRLLSTYMGFGEGAKPILNTEHWTELAKQADVAGNAIEKLRAADSTTSASIKANAEIEIQKLKDLARSYRDAEYAANSLRTKGVTTTKKIETDELNRFINKINDSNVPINKLRRHIEILKSSLSNVTDSQSLVKYLDNFSRVEAKFNSLKALYQSIGSYDKQLDKLAQDWQKQGIYVGNVKTEVENLKASLAKVKTADGLTNWISDFNTKIGAISELPIKIAECRNQLNNLKQVWVDFQGNEKIVSNINKEFGKLGSRLGSIKSESGLAKWSQDLDKINSQVIGLINSLNKQVLAQNNINELQAKIAKLNPTKDSAEITRLNEKLSAEQKTLSNLQMQSNVFSNLISQEQQEQYITEQTLKTREKLLSATNTGVKQYQTTITNAITELQGIANSAVFRNNASNPQVAQTKQDINSLITAYQNLMTKLQGNITPAGLETVRTELTQLNARFNDATTTAKQFEQSLKDDNGAEKLAQKVAVLTARIEAYRKANSKSEKKFGSRYDALLTELANPNIDENAYNRIAKQFQVIRQEVNAANVAGKNFLQTFKEKLGKFTGWMSMTYAVSLFTRSVRQAVVELKDIDTILTEISKTSDRTEASLRRLGYTSFATASKYGQKASDYLLGVQEMSRAGFDEKASEQMAELSTLAQSAGDMTAELANEYLIATNAGYKFGGSAEKLNSVLDSQNYITNHNALSMSELAEATKIVASQASQSGIGIDQMTAAVGTMIATTQQGGEVASRAFKGILMNLQQVKGTAEDIGDGGEDITTESLTKYEEACLDLGVALKEVKDGVLQLRDPMVILEELANAVSKESEGSIKVANLINAVGGKFCLVA